jgi:hypothetical protein
MAKKNFDSLNSIFQEEKVQIPSIIVKKYHSDYDYQNINENDKEKLVNFEEEIIINREEINKNYFKIAKDLYEANFILASYDKTNGKFIKWFESLGLKKTFVYNSIKRYSLFIIYQDEEKINKLSQKAVEILGTKKISDEIRLKVLNEKNIEVISDRNLKDYVLNIISERTEMIKKKEIKNEDKDIKILEIRQLLDEIENKLKEKIDLEQYKKLKKIEKILKEI